MFHEVLADRRSRRKFGSLEISTLSTFLWLGCKTRERSAAASGVVWEHRPAPSAGGRHPIDILILDQFEKLATVSLYDPISHALIQLGCDSQIVQQLAATGQQLLPHTEGLVIWFAAQFDRTLSKYDDGESLVWRDAGALLATMHLTAEALRLNFCALGHTGEPLISAMLEGQATAIGVGGCVVGSRPSD
jgi:SagB-type dehydrogenase family enzyme